MSAPGDVMERASEAKRGVIDRPDIGYDDDAHAYTIDGVPVPGVSTISKVYGGEQFSIGAWWGWGLAVEGVVTLLKGYEVTEHAFTSGNLDDARAALRREEWDPIKKRDAAGVRGNAVHDALEKLALAGTVPDPSEYPEEQRGHVRSLVRWFLHYRPEFEAVEVMVGSRRHMYAGRYDIRARIPGLGLCLIDLKTAKRVYPDSHFVQLEGYEIASVEMGFAPTEGGRWVVRTSEDGSFVAHDERPAHKWDETNFVRSWATPSQYLACLSLYREMAGLGEQDPAALWKREVEAWLLDAVRRGGPAKSRDLAGSCRGIELGLSGRDVGFAFGRLRKRGEVRQNDNKTWEAAA